MRDWFFMTNESTNELFAEAYFPQLEPTGTCQARLVNHGPSSSMETLADVIFMALINARRQILAVTPYFVPPHDILHALRAAALRGVDVKIIVPRKNNHVYAGLAGCGLYEDLLLAGVKVFERDPPFMHAKALLVDDGFALVGTANLDMRSLRLNYETNLAIFDKQFVNTFKPYLLDDLAHSHPVNLLEWRKRPTYRRVLENFAYLLSPIL
jgi:cardiolipin synthase